MERLFSLGMLIGPDALEHIRESEFKEEIVKELSVRNLTFITLKDVLEVEGEIKKRKKVEVIRRRKEILAKEVEEDIKIKECFSKARSRPKGTVDDFIEHFLDRMKSIREVFRSRFPGLSIQTIEQAKKSERVRFVGMVYEVRESASGNRIVVLEDETERISCVVSRKSQIFDKSSLLMGDEVIMVEGVRRGNLVIVEDFYFPDIPFHDLKRIDLPISIAFLSDTHVGSKDFLEHMFLKFLHWLRGEVGDEKQRELASRIKYLIFAGDLVDGVGVYPTQEEDLVIHDIFEQYERFSELLRLVPEHVHIIISPGNHDATRRSDPQPPIPEEVAPGLYEMENVHMVSSPSLVELHGVKVLIYHGNSFDSLIANIPGLTYLRTEGPAIEALRRRHLSPKYGENPIVPENPDFLVIRDVPDIFHTGHLHRNANVLYKGTWVINSGTWQARTEYQIKQGHVPTPGILPLYNMRTGKINLLRFDKGIIW